MDSKNDWLKELKVGDVVYVQGVNIGKDIVWRITKTMIILESKRRFKRTTVRCIGFSGFFRPTLIECTPETTLIYGRARLRMYVQNRLTTLRSLDLDRVCDADMGRFKDQLDRLIDDFVE